QLITTLDGRRIRAIRLGRHIQPFFIPLMYSPFYYEMTALPEAPAQYYPAAAQQTSAMPAKLEITIVDKREDRAGFKANSADASPKQAIVASPAPEELATKVII